MMPRGIFLTFLLVLICLAYNEVGFVAGDHACSSCAAAFNSYGGCAMECFSNLQNMKVESFEPCKGKANIEAFDNVSYNMSEVMSVMKCITDCKSVLTPELCPETDEEPDCDCTNDDDDDCYEWEDCDCADDALNATTNNAIAGGTTTAIPNNKDYPESGNSDLMDYDNPYANAETGTNPLIPNGGMYYSYDPNARFLNPGYDDTPSSYAGESPQYGFYQPPIWYDNPVSPNTQNLYQGNQNSFAAHASPNNYAGGYPSPNNYAGGYQAPIWSPSSPNAPNMYGGNQNFFPSPNNNAAGLSPNAASNLPNSAYQASSVSNIDAQSMYPENQNSFSRPPIANPSYYGSQNQNPSNGPQGYPSNFNSWNNENPLSSANQYPPSNQNLPTSVNAPNNGNSAYNPNPFSFPFGK